MTRQLARRERAVLAIYAAGFAGGALNHGRDFALGGWRPYRWAPPAVELFWTALILLDTLVVLLIVAGMTRTALIVAAGIMLADVAINLPMAVGSGLPVTLPPLLAQTAFLGFVLGSLPLLWPRVGR